MDPMFNEYGYKEPRQPLYNEEDFSIEHIEEQARIQLENFKNPEFVYLSENLYKKILCELLSHQRFMAPDSFLSVSQVMAINTSAGQLTIKPVPNLENFCYVGDETSLEQIEWIRVGLEFEKIFLGEGS